MQKEGNKDRKKEINIRKREREREREREGERERGRKGRSALASGYVAWWWLGDFCSDRSLLLKVTARCPRAGAFTCPWDTHDLFATEDEAGDQKEKLEKLWKLMDRSVFGLQPCYSCRSLAVEFLLQLVLPSGHL